MSIGRGKGLRTENKGWPLTKAQVAGKKRLFREWCHYARVVADVAFVPLMQAKEKAHGSHLPRVPHSTEGTRVDTALL